MRVSLRGLAALFFVLALAAASQAQVIDRVLATIGGRAITLSDARAALALGLVTPAPGADPIEAALSQLIDRNLILADVNRYVAPPPPEAEVTRRLAAVRARFATDAAYRDTMDESAMTGQRLHDWVRDDLRIDAYIDQRFSAPALPTDEEVSRYYETHRPEFIVDGKQLSPAEARDLARERTVAERRRALVADWIDRLRSRTQVVIVGGAGQ